MRGNEKQLLAWGVGRLASRMSLPNATRLLSQALSLENDESARSALSESLLEIMEPIDRAIRPEALGPSIQILKIAIDQQSDARTCGDLTWTIAALVDSFPAKDAATICEPAANKLMSLLKVETDSDAKASLSRGLAATVVFLPDDTATLTTRSLAHSAGKNKSRDHEFASTFYSNLADDRLPFAMGRPPFGPRGVAFVPGPRRAERVKRIAQIVIACLEQEHDSDTRWCLIEILSRCADELEAVNPTLNPLNGALAREVVESVVASCISSNRGSETTFGYKIPEAAVARLEPVDAEKIANSVYEALQPDPNWRVRGDLAGMLAACSTRMEPSKAARMCHQAVLLLSKVEPSIVLNNNRTYIVYPSLDHSFSYMLAHIDANDAKCVVLEMLSRQGRTEAREALCNELSKVATRMRPFEAARMFEEALDRESDALARIVLSTGLRKLAARLESAERMKICGESLRLGLRSRSKNPTVFLNPDGEDIFEDFMCNLIRGLDPTIASLVAREWALCSCTEQDINQRFVAPRLNALLDDTNPVEMERHDAYLMDAMLSGDPFLLEMAMAEPYPCRLSTQDLVELLKMPTVFGPARVVILDQLGNRYHRKFTNHWQFVRYAKEHNLNLDFTTPPNAPRSQGPGRSRAQDPGCGGSEIMLPDSV